MRISYGHWIRFRGRTLGLVWQTDDGTGELDEDADCVLTDGGRVVTVSPTDGFEAVAGRHGLALEKGDEEPQNLDGRATQDLWEKLAVIHQGRLIAAWPETAMPLYRPDCPDPYRVLDSTLNERDQGEGSITMNPTPRLTGTRATTKPSRRHARSRMRPEKPDGRDGPARPSWSPDCSAHGACTDPHEDPSAGSGTPFAPFLAV